MYCVPVEKGIYSKVLLQYAPCSNNVLKSLRMLDDEFGVEASSTCLNPLIPSQIPIRMKSKTFAIARSAVESICESKRNTINAE